MNTKRSFVVVLILVMLISVVAVADKKSDKTRVNFGVDSYVRLQIVRGEKVNFPLNLKTGKRYEKKKATILKVSTNVSHLSWKISTSKTCTRAPEGIKKEKVEDELVVDMKTVGGNKDLPGNTTEILMGVDYVLEDLMRENDKPFPAGYYQVDVTYTVSAT